MQLDAAMLQVYGMKVDQSALLQEFPLGTHGTPYTR